MGHRSSARWLALGLLLALSAGCKDADRGAGWSTSSASATTSGAPAAASVDFSVTGLKACDLYFAAVQSCLPKLDEATRKTLGQDVEQYRRQIEQAKTEASRGMVAVGCEAAQEALADDGCK